MALKLENIRVQQGAFSMSAAWTAGSRLALLGPSGGGKSTLLGVIAGFVTPVAGQVMWGGEDITTWRPADRPLSILFQDNNLFPHLTVRQNVGLGRDTRLRLGPRDWDAIDQAIERVGLADHADKRPGALSGGQQSRAALARVLLMARPLVLLDEPFAALGPALKADMLDLLENVLDDTGAALVMVTHDPDDARRIATDISVVADNVAAPPQPVAALLDNPTGALKDYLG